MKNERFVSATRCFYIDDAADAEHAINLNEAGQPFEDEMFGSGLRLVPFRSASPHFYRETQGTYVAEVGNRSSGRSSSIIIPFVTLQSGAGAPSELVSDTSFASGMGLWGSPLNWFQTVDYATGSFQATHVPGSVDHLIRPVTMVPGKTYAISWEIRDPAGASISGTVRAKAGSTWEHQGSLRSTAGAYVDFVTPLTTTRRDGLYEVGIFPSSDFNGSIASVSVREARSWYETSIRRVDLWFQFMSRRGLQYARDAGSPFFTFRVRRQVADGSSLVFSDNFVSDPQEFPALEASIDSVPADGIANSWAVPWNASYGSIYYPFVFLAGFSPTPADMYFGTIDMDPVESTDGNSDSLERKFLGARIVYDVWQESF